MAARNEIDPTTFVSGKSPNSLKYYFHQFAGGATSQVNVATATADEQLAVLGVIVTNTDASRTANTLVTSANTQMFPGFFGTPGVTASWLSPDMESPICITASGETLKIATVGASSAACDILVIYRSIR